MNKIIFTGILAFATLAVSAKDIKELVVTTTPKLTCQNCEKKIKGNLRFEKGIKNIETSIPDQRVVITYDAEKTTPEKIEQAFQKIKYKVTIVEPEKTSVSKVKK